MKKAKVFRYHVIGLLFWIAVVFVCYFAFCKLTLSSYLQESALGDGLELFVIPGFATALWGYVLAERALGGSYDEPTEWDELMNKVKESPGSQKQS
jgi:hypothetical protein